MKVTACFFKLLGVNMTLVSPIVIGLAITDIILTYYAFDCDAAGGCTLTTGLALTWVGVGLWAPLSTFVVGIAVLKVAGKEFERGWLCLLSFMAGVLFTPALIVVSALAAYYKFKDGVPSSSEHQKQAVFAIEVTNAAVGLVLMLHALGVWIYVCGDFNCCRTHKAAKVPSPQAPVLVEQNDDALNRMNIWSAYRLMENGGPVSSPSHVQQQPLPPPGGAWRTSYYALNTPQARPYIATPLPQAPAGASQCQHCNHQAPKPVLSSGPVYSARPW